MLRSDGQIDLSLDLQPSGLEGFSCTAIEAGKKKAEECAIVVTMLGMQIGKKIKSVI